VAVDLVAPFGDLARRLHGRVVVPSDVDYDGERLLWNAMFDRRPSAIVKCTGAVDVVRALEFVRERGLDFTVCAGRHEASGKSLLDGVVAIDVGPMQGVFVDPVGRRAVVGAGCRWEIVDRECQQYGLAVTGGTNSDTGVAGLTLGGGIGYLMRLCGATVDNLLAINAVTVDGELIRVSETENPELFWGMRGAGANFAIATSFEFALHEVGPVVSAGQLVVPGDRALEAFAVWRDFMDSAPREVATIIYLIRPPAVPPFPPELWGQPLLTLGMLYVGDPVRAQEVMAPLREKTRPVLDTFGPTSYVDFQKGTPPEQQVDKQTSIVPEWRPSFYEKGGYAAALEDEFLEAIVESFQSSPMASGPSGSAVFSMMRMGGAMEDTPDDAMAFSRKAAYWWDVAALWEDPADTERYVTWCRETYPKLEPFATEEGYINLTVRDDIEFLRTVYGAHKFDRLVALKDTWDPDNLLRHNKNIPPSKGAVR
jgi:FAD/FMN-containing dehydrogenase